MWDFRRYKKATLAHEDIAPFAANEGSRVVYILLLEISRFVTAKELSAASFQQQHYHRGCVG